jgi:hypothetical protein
MVRSYQGNKKRKMNQFFSAIKDSIGRATAWVCEKFAQTVAQTIFGLILYVTYLLLPREKKFSKYVGQLSSLQKMPKVNQCLKDENSPNLVTLSAMVTALIVPIQLCSEIF